MDKQRANAQRRDQHNAITVANPERDPGRGWQKDIAASIDAESPSGGAVQLGAVPDQPNVMPVARLPSQRLEQDAVADTT